MSVISSTLHCAVICWNCRLLMQMCLRISCASCWDVIGCDTISSSENMGMTVSQVLRCLAGEHSTCRKRLWNKRLMVLVFNTLNQTNPVPVFGNREFSSLLTESSQCFRVCGTGHHSSAADTPDGQRGSGLSHLIKSLLVVPYIDLLSALCWHRWLVSRLSPNANFILWKFGVEQRQEYGESCRGLY